jgi:hypothetical protein
MEDVSTDYKENSKKFWSFIKSKGQEWTGVAPLKNKMGFLQSDNKSKAERIFFVVSADIFHILFICLSYFILNFLLESFISIDISFLLGFSSFLMSFLLPVDLSQNGVPTK